MFTTKVLETTLRDGSYAINFSFTSSDTTVICKELEEAGVEYIEVGHGVGLQVHEHPLPDSFADFVTKPGQVFTVEPGIYIDGKFGVRLEDMVLVTESGCEVLTSLDRGLNIVG